MGEGEAKGKVVVGVGGGSWWVVGGGWWVVVVVVVVCGCVSNLCSCR